MLEGGALARVGRGEILEKGFHTAHGRDCLGGLVKGEFVVCGGAIARILARYA